MAGGFAEYVAVWVLKFYLRSKKETTTANANLVRIFRQSKKVYKIKNLTDEEATLVEPASCAIHGLDKLNPPVGVEALIVGAGPTGELHYHTTFWSIMTS